MVKNTANFCENCKNHGKDTASINGRQDHYKTQHLALTTIVICNARFSSVFCHIEPLRNKAHVLCLVTEAKEK